MGADIAVADLPLARRRARALVEEIKAEEAQRARAWARTLRGVADLVEEMGRPGAPAGPLASGSASVGAGAPEGVDPVGDPQEAAAAELAGGLGLTLSAASRLVGQALALTGALPTTMSALEAGRIDQARARVVVDGTAALAPADARVVDAQLARSLGPLTTAQLAARIRYLVARLVPDAARRRTRRATCERGVRLFPMEDGMAQLTATGPALDLAAVAERLTAVAQQRRGPHGRTDPHAALAAGLAGPDLLTSDGAASDDAATDGAASDDAATDGAELPDRRRMDARRFDALVDLVLTPGSVAGPVAGPVAGSASDGTALVGAGREGSEREGSDQEGSDQEGATSAGLGAADVLRGTHRGVRGHGGACHGPQVVVALTSLAGLDDEPAQLAGHGAVPAEQVRELLAAGHPYRRALVDAWTGQLLGLDGHLTSLVDPLVGPPRTPRRRGAVEDATSPRPPRPASAPVPSVPSPAASSPSAPSPAASSPAAAPTGCPVAAAGGGRYAPSLPLARFVRTRIQRCTFPGCRMPSTRCDLDHRTPYAAGGPTCECNLEPKCRRHHLAKHRYGWTDELATDDPRDTGTRWTSPLGQVLESPGEPLLPTPPADELGTEEAGPDETGLGAGDTRAGGDVRSAQGGRGACGARGADTTDSRGARHGAALSAVVLGGYRITGTTRSGAGSCAAGPVGRVRPCRATDVADLAETVELSPSLAVGHPYPSDSAAEDAGRTRDEHTRQAVHRAAAEEAARREAEVGARTSASRDDDPPPF